jgi:hypothetical protein
LLAGISAKIPAESASVFLAPEAFLALRWSPAAVVNWLAPLRFDGAPAAAVDWPAPLRATAVSVFVAASISSPSRSTVLDLKKER